jgi:hypothetical protein
MNGLAPRLRRLHQYAFIAAVVAGTGSPFPQTAPERFAVWSTRLHSPRCSGRVLSTTGFRGAALQPGCVPAARSRDDLPYRRHVHGVCVGRVRRDLAIVGLITVWAGAMLGIALNPSDDAPRRLSAVAYLGVGWPGSYYPSALPGARRHRGRARDRWVGRSTALGLLPMRCGRIRSRQLSLSRDLPPADVSQRRSLSSSPLARRALARRPRLMDTKPQLTDEEWRAAQSRK